MIKSEPIFKVRVGTAHIICHSLEFLDGGGGGVGSIVCNFIAEMI